MIAKTEKAKELRRYFVKIESVVHSVISKQVVAPLEITFTPEQINNSNRLINHFGHQKDIFYMFSFKYEGEMYAKFGIVGHLREFHKRVEEHKIEFGEICLHYTVKCKDVSLVESEFKNTSLYRMNKVKIPRKNSSGHHIEIIKLSEAITSDTVKEEMNKIADGRILDPPPRYVESIPITLEVEKEKTKQIQEQEKTRQLQIQLEMKKLELEMKRLEYSTQIQNPAQFQTEDLAPSLFKISDILEESKGSKILLLNIMKRYPKNQDFKCNGYGNYNGFSKKFKTRVEEDINKKFNLSAVKNNGKIYYMGLRFTGHTSFYTKEVYETFVSKYIEIPEASVKFEKIPPGEFKFKIEYEKLQKLFYEHCKEIAPLFEPRCASGFSILFKKEFIEMICKICDVKPPSYSNKTIKYFNGIVYKNDNISE
jgi:hypothetical protein